MSGRLAGLSFAITERDEVIGVTHVVQGSCFHPTVERRQAQIGEDGRDRRSLRDAAPGNGLAAVLQNWIRDPHLNKSNESFIRDMFPQHSEEEP